MLQPQELTIGQVARRSGASVSALRFYEAKGLLRSVRNEGNQRRYSRDVLRRVAFIRAAQRVGIPLGKIREALGWLPEERTPTAADWARLSAQWREELDQRIRVLKQVRDELTGCIGCGCLSLKTCRLVNRGDVLGQEGAGARRWATPNPHGRRRTRAT